MIVAKVFASLIVLFLLSYFTEAENVFSKPGNRYTYEYHVDLQIDHEYDDIKKIGYKVYFDVYPKNNREYVIDITDAKPYHGEDVIVNPAIHEFKGPFLVKRLKSRNVNKYSDYKLTFTNSKESVWSQNLKKALVTLFEIDYRPNEITYDVSQEGIAGTCNYKYVIDRRPHRDLHGAFLSYVTRVKDDTVLCFKEKTHHYFLKDKVAQCHQKTDLHSKRNYFYTINELSVEHLVVKHVEASEQIHLVYGEHYNASYPIVSKQILHLVNEEIYSPEQSSNQKLKDFFTDKSKGDYLQTTLEGYYQPYYGHATIDEKYFIERINHLAPKLKLVNEGKNIDYKQFLHYEDIIFKLFKANYDEIKHLFDLTYTNVDLIHKIKIFFTFLQQVPHYDGVKFVLDTAKEYIISAQVPDVKHEYILALVRYLHSAKFPLTIFSYENGEHFLNFCKQDFVKNDRHLHKVCYLAFSRLINEHCTKLNPSCSIENADYFLNQTLTILDFKYFDQTHIHKLHNENQILAVKVLKNFRLQSGLPALRSVVLDKELHIVVRTEAAWALYYYNHFDEPLLKTILNIVNDRKEDYEIRLAGFFSILKTKAEYLIPTVVRLANNFVKHTYEDDKQFVHGVYHLLHYGSQNQITTCNEKFIKGIQLLYKYIGKEYKQYIVHKPLESLVYFDQPNDGRQIVYGLAAAKKGYFPRGLFFEYGDSFNVQSFTFFGQHKNILRLFSADPNAPTYSEHIGKFIQSLNLPVAHDLKEDINLVTYALNHYDAYFVYSDVNTQVSQLDFLALLGSPLKNLFYIDYGSITETGFPYYFHAKQSRFVYLKPDTSKFSLLAHFNTYGYISSTVFLPLTDYYLLKARNFNKYMKHDVSVSINKYSFEHTANEIEGEIQFKTIDYYETVKKFHYIQSYKILPFYFFHDAPAIELVPRKYETKIDSSIPHFKYHTILPFGHCDTVDDYLKYLHLVWLPRDTLFHHKYYTPYEKHFYLENAPKTIGFKLHQKFVDDYNEYYIHLHQNLKPFYELSLRHKNDYTKVSSHYILRVKNYLRNHNSLVKVDILYPLNFYSHQNIHQIFTHLKNATVGVKIYLSTDLSKDLKPGEDELYTQAQGILYKKITPDRLYEFQQAINHGHEIQSEYYLKHIYNHIIKYDTVDLDITQLKQLPENHRLSLKTLYAYFNYFYPKFIVFDPYVKTESNQIKLHFGSYYYYNYYNYHNKEHLVNGLNTNLDGHTIDTDIISTAYGHKVNTGVITTPFGQSKLEDYPSYILEYLFPLSEYFLKNNHYPYSFMDIVSCYIKPDHIETFDGLKLFNLTFKYDKPLLIAIDHDTYEFAVTSHEKHVYTILYYQGLNITLHANSKLLYVDGQAITLDVTTEPKVYHHKHFYIVYALFDGKPVYELYFANHLTFYHDYDHFEITLGPRYIGAVSGLCGSYDRNYANDLVNKVGEEILPLNYYDGWKY